VPLALLGLLVLSLVLTNPSSPLRFVYGVFGP
jgi:hypothetical protein